MNEDERLILVVVAARAVKAVLFARFAARGTPFGLVLEPFFGIERLLAFIKNEIAAAVHALQSLVRHIDLLKDLEPLVKIVIFKGRQLLIGIHGIVLLYHRSNKNATVFTPIY